MTSGVNFWDESIWTLVGTLAILFAVMILANML